MVRRRGGPSKNKTKPKKNVPADGCTVLLLSTKSDKIRTLKVIARVYSVFPALVSACLQTDASSGALSRTPKILSDINVLFNAIDRRLVATSRNE